MSNLIPPLLSSSPPPIVGHLEEEDEDEFGDFRAATDSYDCDDFSPPPSPQISPAIKEQKAPDLDINRNNSQKLNSTNDQDKSQETVDKDFQDRRKSDPSNLIQSCEIPIDSRDNDMTGSEPASSGVPCPELPGSVDGLKESGAGDNGDRPSKVESHCQLELETPNTFGVDNSETEKEICSCNLQFEHEQDCSEDECRQVLEDDIQNQQKVDETTIIYQSEVEVERINNDNFSEDFGCANFENITSACEEEESGMVSEKKVNLEFENPSQQSENCTESLLEEHEFTDFALAVPENLEATKIQQNFEQSMSEHEFSSEKVDDFKCESFIKSALEDDEDDFTDFVMPPSSETIKNVESENDQEFGNFTQSASSIDFPLSSLAAECKIDEPESFNDDFGDFESNFPSNENDEFGNFSMQPDASDFEQPALLLDFDKKNVFSKSEAIVKEIFSLGLPDEVDFDHVDKTKSNFLLNELKDITETKALTYQWSKSNSQKIFLRALNIDMRNILYGPAWNSSMPRYAANLSLSPLEPVKSEILSPIPVQSATSPSSLNTSQKSTTTTTTTTTSSSSSAGTDIPLAQFDWTGSGLVNPFDYSQTLLLDLEELVASLDIPSSSNPPLSQQSPSLADKLLDDWDVWLQSTGQPSATTETPPEDARLKDDTSSSSPLDVEAPEQTPASTLTFLESKITEPCLQEQPKQLTPIEPTLLETSTERGVLGEFTLFQSQQMFPLRETHISNDGNGLANRSTWLEPTVLATVVQSSKGPDTDDDEFDDFQMVLPNHDTKAALEENEVSDQVAEPPEHIFQSPNQQNTREQLHESTSKSIGSDDDEFTDFHSSLPQPVASVAEAPAHLQPLKPITIQPVILQHTLSQPLQISWPDPGITDDDIRNIELSYSRKAEPLEIKSAFKDKQQSSSNDDDEWSDFVSVNNPSVQKSPERTATPDLPLSVLNLNNVQPARQPIPVITPSGLVQTKLSSSLQPKPSNIVQTSVVHEHMFKSAEQLQPSIISNQFSRNMFKPSDGGFHGLQPQAVNNITEDEDDWSDFVSSQPLPQTTTNGFQQYNRPSYHQAKPTTVQFPNWGSSASAPNIITNPVHFESFQSFGQPPQSSSESSTRNKQPTGKKLHHAIPSISAMPELDFIAPKTRTHKK